MTKQRWMICTAAMLIVCLLICGYAAATAGDSNDPLITQSYLELVLTPKAVAAAQTAAQAQATSLKTQFDSEVDILEQSLYTRIDTAAAALANDANFIEQVVDAGGKSAAGWVEVRLSSGDVLTLTSGSELVLRSGTATCVGTLINVTNVSNVAAGTAISANTYFKSMSVSSGVQASGACTVLVYGSYNVA